MKKTVACFLMLIILGFTGCSLFVPREISREESALDENAEAEDNETVNEELVSTPVSLEVLAIDYGNTGDYWLGSGGIKEQVEAKNPNISLNVTILPWEEAFRELETRLYNDNPFDMAVTDDIEDLSERGVLVSTLKYADSDLLGRINYGFNTDKGIPVGVDPYVLYIKEETSMETGIGEASLESVGWTAIIHGKEDHINGMIPFFIDVTPGSKELSFEALYKSTEEKNDSGIAGSLISEVSSNPKLRHKTAYEGVVGVCNGEIAMAVAPKGILSVLEDVDTSDLLTLNLPGSTKMLCDYLVVFKKSREDEDRLNACKAVIREFYGDGYTKYIEGEGFDPAF